MFSHLERKLKKWSEPNGNRNYHKLPVLHEFKFLQIIERSNFFTGLILSCVLFVTHKSVIILYTFAKLFLFAGSIAGLILQAAVKPACCFRLFVVLPRQLLFPGVSDLM
jgi:hypothetical protein